MKTAGRQKGSSLGIKHKKDIKSRPRVNPLSTTFFTFAFPSTSKKS